MKTLWFTGKKYVAKVVFRPNPNERLHWRKAHFAGMCYYNSALWPVQGPGALADRLIGVGKSSAGPREEELKGRHNGVAMVIEVGRLSTGGGQYQQHWYVPYTNLSLAWSDCMDQCRNYDSEIIVQVRVDALQLFGLILGQQEKCPVITKRPSHVV